MTAAENLIIGLLTNVGGPVNSTRLVKLVYLVDYLHYQYYGDTATDFEYMWDHFGPNAVSHAIVGTAEELVRRKLLRILPSPNIYGGLTILFEVDPSVEEPDIPPETDAIIEDVVRQYGRLSTEQITEVSKQTEPFKDATPYRVLSMHRSSPAEHTTESDYEAFQRDLRECGTLSLGEIKARYSVL